jgi:hypothetical protein
MDPYDIYDDYDTPGPAVDSSPTTFQQRLLASRQQEYDGHSRQPGASRGLTVKQSEQFQCPRLAATGSMSQASTRTPQSQRSPRNSRTSWSRRAAKHAKDHRSQGRERPAAQQVLFRSLSFVAHLLRSVCSTLSSTQAASCATRRSTQTSLRASRRLPTLLPLPRFQRHAEQVLRCSAPSSS